MTEGFLETQILLTDLKKEGIGVDGSFWVRAAIDLSLVIAIYERNDESTFVSLDGNDEVVVKMRFEDVKNYWLKYKYRTFLSGRN
jgi:hypothetical protein